MDALVSWYVLSSISDTHWRESELLRELIRDRAVKLRHLSNMFVYILRHWASYMFYLLSYII